MIYIPYSKSVKATGVIAIQKEVSLEGQPGNIIYATMEIISYTEVNGRIFVATSAGPQIIMGCTKEYSDPFGLPAGTGWNSMSAEDVLLMPGQPTIPGTLYLGNGVPGSYTLSPTMGAQIQQQMGQRPDRVWMVMALSTTLGVGIVTRISGYIAIES